MFKKKSGFVSLFQDKKLVDSTAGGLAYRIVEEIHYSKTIEQRSLFMDLTYQHWCDIGESAAADHFRKMYCSQPAWNWNLIRHLCNYVGICNQDIIAER